LGSTHKGKKIGSISNLTAFSLYSNKIITTGEGGIITTPSLKMANTLRKINNYSFSKVRHFWHTQVGYNFRMSNIQAAVGLGQLEHIDSILSKKKCIADWYRKKLAPLNEKINEFAAKGPWESNYWHIAYRLNLKYPVMSLRDFLAKKNIETRGFFIPLHLQPIYRSADSKNRFINSEILAKTGILLPSGPTLTEPVVNLICETIKEFF
jgi:perosamine synthetase